MTKEDARVGEQLVSDLMADPRKFDSDGRAHDLLQVYFAGFPLQTLRSLLRHDDELVQRAAVFIASELGHESRDVVDDVIPLIHSKDRYLQYHAMEVVAVGGKGDQAATFAHVARALENQDDVLRALAMRLVSRADVSQLEAAGRSFEAPDSHHRTHAYGLHVLVAGHRVEPAVVGAMMHDADPLNRRYGAIAAKRLLREVPQLTTEAKASDDADVRRLFET